MVLKFLIIGVIAVVLLANLGRIREAGKSIKLPDFDFPSVTDSSETRTESIPQRTKQQETEAINKNLDRILDETGKVNAVELARTPKEDRKLVRKELERRIPDEIKFSTSLEDAPLSTGVQLFRGKNDLVIEQIKQREANRSEQIFNSLFGNVQNPNFDLGLPSSATAADREFFIKQQQQNTARNKRNARRDAENKRAEDSVKNLSDSQLVNLLKSKGVNLQGSINRKATIRALQRLGVI